MKVIILINSNPFFSASASANRWLTLIEGLSELGMEIQIMVVGNYHSKQEKAGIETNKMNNGILIKYLNPKMVDNLWKRRFHKYLGNTIQNIKSKRLIKKELIGFNGILWPENDVSIWKMIPNLQNRPFKLIAEMSEFLDIHNFNTGNILQRKLGDAKQKYFENHFIHNLNGFILMTKTLLNHYQKFPPPLPNFLHLPMTVDLNRFNENLDILEGFDAPYIAFVGVMNDAKDGVDILIKAFGKIHTEFPAHKVYLVGSWNYDTPKHLKLIEELNLQKKVFWKGEYSRDQIPAIIKNANLLVLPRPDSKQAQGGFPTKLGEYLATGNPICATTVGEIPDYLVDGESVYFAKPGSIDSFLDAMKKALMNTVKSHEVGFNGRKIAETRFNKEVQSKLLYNFLKQMMNENSK
jgi:glycosyltransferase involved in cell wall biosynthesis